MAKGYWIARVDVSDMEAYQQYVQANAAPFAEFKARFLVRDSTFTKCSHRIRQLSGGT